MKADLFLLQHLTLEKTTAPQSEVQKCLLIYSAVQWTFGRRKTRLQPKDKRKPVWINSTKRNYLQSLLKLIFLQSMIDVKEWFRHTSCTCQASHVFSVNTHTQTQAKKHKHWCAEVFPVHCVAAKSRAQPQEI